MFGAIGVFLCLVGLVVALLLREPTESSDLSDVQARADSLALANDELLLAQEFNQLSADFSQYEDQQIYLQNDSLVQQYNESRKRVEQLMRELDAEKKKGARSESALRASRDKIKQLEGEIATLKGIVHHYLEEITRLGQENDGLRKEVAYEKERNTELSNQVTQATADNRQLNATVQLAKKLNITGLSFHAYNKKGKVEKNVTKGHQLGASFTVSPNNTAAPGMKTFYMRVISPEGALLGAGPNFTIDGKSVQSTASRNVEYANDEISVSIYWDVNTTLTPGDYTVEIFCDGYRLASRHFTLSK